MNSKKIVLTFLTVLISLMIFSQEVVYIDENLQSIDALAYSKKCKLEAFKCNLYEVDSLIIYKVLPKFNFGKIDETAYNQIRKLLMRDTQEEITPNKTLIIKFYDTIFPYKTAFKNHVKHMETVHNVSVDSNETVNIKHASFNEESFNKSREKFVVKSNKCLKKFEDRFNSEIFYMVDEDNGITHEYSNFNWVIDNGFFKNNFFKFRSHYGTVFIKPDGEFFLIGSHFSDSSAKKLLKDTDWSKHKNDWQKTLTNKSNKSYGIFKTNVANGHYEHCF
tara:strand:- start:26797 stop:27627 length:831 start_codon:yes stop_codon:yes gene_type:complete